MSDFRPIASVLAARAARAASESHTQMQAAPEPAELQAPSTPPEVFDMLRQFAEQFMMLRARTLEIFETCAESAVRLVADDVLGRELELAPAEISELIAKVRTELAGTLELRVAPETLDHLESAPDLTADETLTPGDLVVHTPYGSVDMRMGTRAAELVSSIRVDV